MRNRNLHSIVFLTFTTCCIYSCNDERVPETFLIDKDFRGDFYIIYNQKGAQKEKFEGESRVYEIPKTGVLFTEFEPDWRGMTYHNGRTRQKFYLVDEHGTRKEITEWGVNEFKNQAIENPKMDKYASDTVAAFFIAAGEMGLDDNKMYTFDQYFIGPYDMLEVTDGFRNSYIDSLRIQQVNNGLLK